MDNRKELEKRGLLYPETPEGKKCSGNCKNEQAERCVPFFDVQNTMMHYNWANRRMLIVIIAVLTTRIVLLCVTASIVNDFTTNQTKREQMWQDTIKSIVSPTTVAEVEHGQQNADH